MRIAVAGNIGSGKTTLTSLLSKHYSWEAFYENADDNPYLFSFYEDMQRWAFNLQINFLNSRLKKIMQFQDNETTVIHDRTVFEDAEIFAPNLHEMGLLTSRDLDTYKELYDSIVKLVKPPDLLICLKASVPTLVSLIQKRGREYENSIRLDYLTNLNERYDKFFDRYEAGKKLIIDVDKINFADKPEDFGSVINRVEAEVNSLFDHKEPMLAKV